MKKKEVYKMIQKIMDNSQSAEKRKGLSDYVNLSDIDNVPENQKINACCTKIQEAFEKYMEDNMEKIFKNYVDKELNKSKEDQRRINKKIEKMESFYNQNKMNMTELKQEVEVLARGLQKTRGKVKIMRKIMQHLGEILYGRKAADSLGCFEKKIKSDAYDISNSYTRGKKYSLFKNMQEKNNYMLERKKVK